MTPSKVSSSPGFITVDFMLAMIVTLGCMLLLLRVSLSLVSAQLAQYVVYAAARAQSAADESREVQIQAGQDKYKKLLATRGLAAGFLLRGETIDKDASVGDHSQVYPSASASTDGNQEAGIPSWGARAQITLRSLSFIPFLGKMTESEDEFKAHVTALIFREPSYKECRSFFEAGRYEELLNRDGRFSQARNGVSINDAYVALEDSGC